MDSLKIIQSAYSIVLYNILNIIRHDDDGDCDMNCCGTNTYDYFDHFMITYLPYDDDYPKTGSFYITFYEKYSMKLIKKAMEEVHEFWKKDVEDVLQRCENKWVSKIEGNELNLENTIGLFDSERFLMKPMNDYTFMTLFTVANYFDMYRISPVITNHLIDHFIVNESLFYDFLNKIKYNDDQEYDYERITECGHQKDYVFVDSFSRVTHKDMKRIGIPTHDFDSVPYIMDNMENVIMVKAYSHMADKIIQKDFHSFFNEHYSIRFIKNSDLQYLVILEFSKSYTYDMVSKTIRFVNHQIEIEIEESDVTGNYDRIQFMKPIHNRMLFSIIQYDNIETKPNDSTEFLQKMYHEEYVLDEEEYNVEIEYDHFYGHRYNSNNYSSKFETPCFR